MTTQQKKPWRMIERDGVAFLKAPAQHTHGPWAIGGHEDEHLGLRSIVIACGKDQGELVAEVFGEDRARLIAAAPELLDVAIWLDKFLNGKFKDPDIDGAKDMVASVIAKATGGA